MRKIPILTHGNLFRRFWGKKMIHQMQDKIILKPFKSEFFKDIKISLVFMVCGGVAGFFLEKQDYKGIAWGFAIVAMLYMVWHYIFKYHTTIIFDLRSQKIYAKNWWGSREILLFREAELLLQTNNYGSLSYHLARKSDRYKSLQRISSYHSEKEMETYEKEVVSVIVPLLDTNGKPNKSSINETNFYPRM